MTFASDTRFSRPELFEESVVQDVKPTDDSVQNHPQNRMIDAPRDCNRQHAAKAPETDACRLMVLHLSSCSFRMLFRANPRGLRPAALFVAPTPAWPHQLRLNWIPGKLCTSVLRPSRGAAAPAIFLGKLPNQNRCSLSLSAEQREKKFNSMWRFCLGECYSAPMKRSSVEPIRSPTCSKYASKLITAGRVSKRRSGLKGGRKAASSTAA
jgi:hypothetical protein